MRVGAGKTEKVPGPLPVRDGTKILLSRENTGYPHGCPHLWMCFVEGPDHPGEGGGVSAVTSA